MPDHTHRKRDRPGKGEASEPAASSKAYKDVQLYTPSSSGGESLESLRETWKVLYSETLPHAARERCIAQPKWPVTLDHCFARIILDNAVGRDKPWTQVLKNPAIRNMSAQQLKASIALGTDILEGHADLVELDERSLELRGKKSKNMNKQAPSKKRSSADVNDAAVVLMEGRKRPRTGVIDLTEDEVVHLEQDNPEEDKEEDETGKEHHKQEDLDAIIDGSDKTEFQKKCLKLLCQIPAGRFSTYGAMSAFLSSSPRAVGSAMRGNPFAPRVPCHRILAADRSIGGFGGSWGAQGEHANEKLELLRREGVRFDSKGKVLGQVFTRFTEV